MLEQEGCLCEILKYIFIWIVYIFVLSNSLTNVMCMPLMANGIVPMYRGHGLTGSLWNQFRCGSV